MNTDQTDPLLLPVDYDGEELEFEMKIQHGYITRAEILIGGIPVVFETDNNEEYRALISPEQIEKSKHISFGLLQAIAAQLQVLFN